MFVVLLIVTFVVALGVSMLVVRMFNAPIERILQRIIPDAISIEWARYLKFAIYVVGISSGVRVWDLEKYITPSPTEFGEYAQIVELTMNRWILELYRTVISTLQGAAWVLLVFFVFALIAYVIVRVFEGRQPKQPHPEAA